MATNTTRGAELGVNRSDSGSASVHILYDANSVTRAIFIATVPCVVTGIYYQQRVASTSGTAKFYKAPSGVAAASGTALHTTAFDLSNAVTVDTTYTATDLVSDISSRTLKAGDAIAVVFSGTMTSGVGLLQVFLEPLA